LGLLLLFFLIIGGGTIYFTIEQYEDNHVWNVSEKTSSVLVELQHKLGGSDSLGKDMAPEIFYYIMKFSHVFYSDINVYDLNGRLIAGSRPEIFNRSLQNQLMDPKAYYQMKVKKKARYIHQERIGSMEFASAYVPFRNNRNEHLAYLNLPYFSRQDELSREIWNVIVGIINAYVALIMLGIVLAVFVSAKLTGPLRLISQKIGKVKLGGANEKIRWKGRDEIAGLVEQYNLMIDELAESAELLAKSERETAWREMAKQIAHEIKNPLTPMKLSAQLLLRSWEDEDPDFEAKLRKVSQTLISQIVNLSSIATAFSDFAKMPRPENRPVVIAEVLAKSISLYEDTENTHIQTHIEGKAEKAQCKADKEQMLSVFNNLLQNAIQAIPEDREGHIQVSMLTEGRDIVIRFKDNGTGIPGEMREKLFQPNFTTKSGGTGLGLAIVKNIISSSGGRIELSSGGNDGAEFTIKLPRIT
jgi:nitrogen fixation/metabolism regulation signal transduction histidine kinase